MAQRDEGLVLSVEAWPPDDTEESILGTGLHQQAISSLCDALRDAGSRQDAAWGVGNQLELLGLTRRNGTAYRTYQDVMAHPCARDLRVGSVSLAQDGPPLLIVEVASASTWRNDVDELRGKAEVYGRCGVREYLVFDPTGDALGAQVWARGVGAGGYELWGPEADGRWHSRLGVSFAPGGVLLHVYDHAGNHIPGRSELQRQLADEARRRAELEEELRQFRAGVEPHAQG